MHPAPLLLPHLGSCGSLALGVFWDAPCSSFADAIRWSQELGAGSVLGCTLLLFCCRTLAVAGAWCWGWFRMPPASLLLTQSGGCGRLATGPLKLPGCGSKRGRRGIRERPHLRSSATAGVRQRKEEGRASGSVPDFRWCQGLIQEAKPRQLPGQNPRNRRCERSGQSPECRRQRLFS